MPTPLSLLNKPHLQNRILSSSSSLFLQTRGFVGGFFLEKIPGVNHIKRGKFNWILQIIDFILKQIHKLCEKCIFTGIPMMVIIFFSMIFQEGKNLIRIIS